MSKEKWCYHDNDIIEIHPVGDEDEGTYTIADMSQKGHYNRKDALAHAERICTAVNNHGDLLDVCKQAVCGNMGWKGKLRFAIAKAEKNIV